jgi:hypothetical protein
MTESISRRGLLAGAGGVLALRSYPMASGPGARSAELNRDIKLTLPVRELTDEALSFVAYLGVEYTTTGGPHSPHIRRKGASCPSGESAASGQRAGFGYAVGQIKAMMRQL